jgi:hypothetical protein
MLVSMMVVVSFGFLGFVVGERLKGEKMGKYVLFGRFWGFRILGTAGFGRFIDVTW